MQSVEISRLSYGRSYAKAISPKEKKKTELRKSNNRVWKKKIIENKNVIDLIRRRKKLGKEGEGDVIASQPTKDEKRITRWNIQLSFSLHFIYR